MRFLFLAYKQLPQHLDFRLWIFLKDDRNVGASFNVWAYITMPILALISAESDGTLVKATSIFATRAFWMVEEPHQPLTELCKGKTCVSPKTMLPPV